MTDSERITYLTWKKYYSKNNRQHPEFKEQKNDTYTKLFTDDKIYRAHEEPPYKATSILPSDPEVLTDTLDLIRAQTTEQTNPYLDWVTAGDTQGMDICLEGMKVFYRELEKSVMTKSSKHDPVKLGNQNTIRYILTCY